MSGKLERFAEALLRRAERLAGESCGPSLGDYRAAKNKVQASLEQRLEAFVAGREQPPEPETLAADEEVRRYSESRGVPPQPGLRAELLNLLERLAERQRQSEAAEAARLWARALVRSRPPPARERDPDVIPIAPKLRDQGR